MREVLAHAFALLQGLQHRGVGVGAGALVAAVLVDALHQRPAGGGHVEGVVRALQRKKVRQYSRPRVSDDNAFVESLFRTAKYRPQYPEAGFADLQAARQWASNFVHWYNHEHRHSGIRWRHAGACHAGLDQQILQVRHALYAQAREDNPLRWSGPTRDWSLIKTVTLNPERTEVQNAALTRSITQPMAA